MMWPRLTDLPTPLRPIIASVWPASTKKLHIDQNWAVERLIYMAKLDVMWELVAEHCGGSGTLDGVPVLWSIDVGHGVAGFFPFHSHIFEHAQQPELAPVQGSLNPSQTAMPINGAEWMKMPARVSRADAIPIFVFGRFHQMTHHPTPTRG